VGWSGGTFTRVHDWTTDEGSAIDIEASRMDAEDDNFASGINACIHKGGTNTPTANLPMGGYRHTGVDDAAALTDYASAADVIDQHLVYYVDTGSTNTYVITPSPAISAYAEGQKFVFRATNDNTGSSTLNVNAVGTAIIYTPDGGILVGGEILDGSYYEVIYNTNGGGKWFLMSPVANAQYPEVVKYKSADESVTSSETLQNDNHLVSLLIPDAKVCRLRGTIFYTQNTGDLKFSLEFSNSPSDYRISYQVHDVIGTEVNDISITHTENISITTMQDAGTAVLIFDGTFTSNATGGNLTLQWAQNTSSGNATTLTKGSWMSVEKLEA
jgi:hypothetical protein